MAEYQVESLTITVPGLFHGPVQTPRCHQPSEQCFPALFSQQELRDGSRSVSILFHKTANTSISFEFTHISLHTAG